MFFYRTYYTILALAIFLIIGFLSPLYAARPIARVIETHQGAIITPDTYDFGISGYPIVSNPQFLAEIELNTHRLYPEIYSEIRKLQKEGGERRFFGIGDSTRFFAINIPEKVYYLFSAELRAIGTKSNIWVEKSQWAAKYVTETEVNEILEIMESKTPSSSRNPSKGVVDLEAEYFGVPPNVDGDNKTDIILLDIRDGWEPGRAYIAGYFSSTDQRLDNENSNKRDIVYIDVMPNIYWPFTGTRRTSSARETLGHEFQHLINYHYDKSEETWVNEGLSTYAQYLNGFGLESFADYLVNTNRSLNQIKGDIDIGADPELLIEYHKVQLFTFYLWEQFGDEAIREIVQSPRHGIEGIRDGISKSGSSLSFSEVLVNWAVTNMLNNHSIGTNYGYRDTLVQSIKATPQYEHFNYPIPPVDHELNPYGYEYIHFSGAETLQVAFNAHDVIIRAIKIGLNRTEVVDVPADKNFIDNEFGRTITDIIFVVVNPTHTSITYSYSASALQSTLLTEIAYDNGEPDVFAGTATFLGFGANTPGYGWAVKFHPPAPSAVLLSSRIYLYSPNLDDFEFHIWDDTGVLGKPGSDVIPPFDVKPTVAGAGTWIDIDLSGSAKKLTNFTGDFYVGVVHKNNAGVYIGMDDSEPSNKATWGYLGAGTSSGGWYHLGDLGLFQIVGQDTTVQKLTGFNMMFRVKMSVDISAIPPSSPRNLIAKADEGKITLKWSANNERDMASYNLYRSVIADIQVDSLLLLKKIDKLTTEYTDNSVNPGVVYYYRLTAVDKDFMESKPGNLVNAQAPLVGERIIDDSTTALYHFNEKNGNKLFDESPNNFDGTIYRAVWDQNGRFGSALSFDGKTSAIEISSIPLGGTGKNFTIEFWYKLGSGFLDEDRVFITQGYRRFTLGKWYIIYNKEQQSIEAGAETVDGILKKVSTTKGLDVYRWHHLAFVRDADADILRMYIDNELVAQTNFDGAFDLENSFFTHVGRDARVIDNVRLSNYVGWIDELRISKISRSSFDVITGIRNTNEKQEVPEKFALYQNYPNPFNPATTITFDFPVDAEASAKIFNIQGREIWNKSLGIIKSGHHSFVWDGSNNSGIKVASGIYLYQIKTSQYTATKKMLLIR